MSLLVDLNDDMGSGSVDELDVPEEMPPGTTGSGPKTAPAHATSFPIHTSEQDPSSAARIFAHHNHNNSHSLTSRHSLPQLPKGPYSSRYFPRHPSYRLSRDDLRELASSTLDALDKGLYWPPGRQEGHDEHYDLKTKIQETIAETAFYAPDDEFLSGWAEGSGKNSVGESNEEVAGTKIIIGEYSTLVGARKLYDMVNAGKGDHEEKERVGVLNFASAKKPGGGFLNGAQAQEESIARSSTLYPSLLTPAAKSFYRFYSEDPDNAFYTHAMVYSPSIIIFRNDKGNIKSPIEVDVLTSAAVNAGDVRKQVRWEEEMRELRERVRVAELSRFKAHDRVQREQHEENEVWKEEREAYAAKERQDSEREGEEKRQAISVASTRSPSSIIHVDGSDSVNSTTEPYNAGRSDSSQQLSPIIFASDPDPLPPPIQLQPSTSGQSGSGHSRPPGLDEYYGSPRSQVHEEHPDILEVAELQIASEMHERIARILCLFQLRGVRHLVLGSFGTGVFQNSVELVAGIFRDLLCGEGTGEGVDGVKSNGTVKADESEEGGEDLTKTPTQAKPGPSMLNDAPFKGAFSTVVFAILGGSTVRTFKDVFENEDGVETDEDGEGSDVDAMKDLADVRKEDRYRFARDGKSDDKPPDVANEHSTETQQGEEVQVADTPTTNDGPASESESEPTATP